MFLSQEPTPKNTLVQALMECVVVVGLFVFLVSPLVGVFYEKEFSTASTTHKYPVAATRAPKN